MADPFGRPAGPDPLGTAADTPAADTPAADMDTDIGPDSDIGPGSADPLDERLRGLARDTEPLVVLAGAPAARRLGERRRARRRTGAVSLVAALAVAVGTWQLLPGSDGPRGTGALPGTVASTTPPPEPPDPAALAHRLTDELLPPGALPFFPVAPWKTLAPGTALKLMGACPVPSPAGDVQAGAVRLYGASAGEEAEYLLYAFTDAEAARYRTERFGEAVKDTCGVELTTDLGTTGEAADSPVTYQGSSRTGTGVQILMNRQGAYLAVLLIRGLGNPLGSGSDYANKHPQPIACIAASLNRLTEAGARPSASMSPPDVSIDGTSGGVGSGVGGGSTMSRGFVGDGKSC
ncbi:hypothetical protein ABZX65_34990 [Streptomyces sp. NPDC003300]|uniref:hypothetical protein n=1 Tax=unclassified Streptomyces TaxID=2593676 RepID=UPI0033AAE369